MTSPSSSVQEARKAFGRRLAEIRMGADLTKRELARRLGWHESKASRFESGTRAPSERDLRAWCTACDADDDVEDLITTARGIEGMYVEWRKMERHGLKWAQESVVPLWERTERFRIYSPWLIPGPVQTASYITALLTSIRDRRGLVDDVPAAVAVRMEKQKIVYGNHKFAILLEESVLRYRIGGTDVMAGQLGYLLSAMALPSVSIGIIPQDADRTSLWPVEGFFLYDDATVNVELVSAHLTVVQQHELAMYAKTFSDLAELAVYGGAARELITAAIESLG
ncbi:MULTISPECIES: helix-turn-helix domain-containing protein [Streptomyces]|uniref:helix-turn-helix domain-containing protein n=1 Tax=Streptomyces TaxID=1883 RepID=UPI00163BBFA5|nr:MULTISPECIES: helix-turn-helix transcriptional regulator [Streptomyces]MBC2876221.1 helix-turn-helix domain-containing protein [Streptomyces sp. TYQ1024]UBI35554.1 helix-turn-helix domain-containing protein [Streptomyces mobaraensis]UKW28148.1 helix-turn-helix domain-containing protein [Streptomyces sp. TYQ1024]